MARRTRPVIISSRCAVYYQQRQNAALEHEFTVEAIDGNIVISRPRRARKIVVPVPLGKDLARAIFKMAEHIESV